MQTILIAPDSFKGSLSATEVADAIAEGICGINPDCRLIKMPMSDGGDGMLSALSGIKSFERITLMVRGPLGKRVSADYLITGKTAIIETAQACGLTLLGKNERNPSLTSTHGIGDIINDALDRGCRKFMIGLGGSSTNDGGIGMLETLGCRFVDKDGERLKNCNGGSLEAIAEIDMSGMDKRLYSSDFVIACDVDAVFSGNKGATEVFAAQKGADTEMVEALEKGMKSFESLIKTTLGIDLSAIAGSGAAGGLGGAFKTFLNGRIRRGADIIMEINDLDKALKESDFVITGEGKIDGQTIMGKMPSAIALKAAGLNIPTIAICGTAGDDLKGYLSPFTAILTLQDSIKTAEELEYAMKPEVAKESIRRTIVEYLSKSVKK